MDMSDLFFLNLQKRDYILSIADSYNLRNDFNKFFYAIDKNIQNYRRNIDYLLELVGSRLSQTILDIGCGSGRDIMELANIGYKCIGLDRSKTK